MGRIRYLDEEQPAAAPPQANPAAVSGNRRIRYVSEGSGEEQQPQPPDQAQMDNFIQSMKSIMVENAQQPQQPPQPNPQQQQIQAAIAQKVQQIQDEDPKNWSSSRFRKEFPKPRTAEEQVFYDMMLEEKKATEAGIRKKIEDGRSIAQAIANPGQALVSAAQQSGQPAGQAVGKGYLNAREHISQRVSELLPEGGVSDQHFPVNAPNPQAVINPMQAVVQAGQSVGAPDLVKPPQVMNQVGQTTPRELLKESTGLIVDEISTAGIGGTLGFIMKGVARAAGGAVDLVKTLPKIVDQGIMKGVKPSAQKLKNIAGVQKYKEDAQRAVAAVYDNRKALGLKDELGQVVEKLPETVHEFSEAISSTKASIFSKYDQLKQQAGALGAKVNLKAIAKDINGSLDASKKVLKTVAPDALRYLQTRVEALKKAGSFTANEAQDAIKVLNRSLETFYRNPSYEAASKAVVDAGIAGSMRRSLDTVIEGATGKQYQALRNVYKSLKTIESDVAKRVVVEARKSGKGLLDFSDIFSGAEIVRGLVHLDPGSMAAGGTARAIKEYIKKINSPNEAIKMMFRKYDKAVSSVISKSKGI